MWLRFNEKSIGQQTSNRGAAFTADDKIPKGLVPIAASITTDSLNPGKTIVVKRKYFPLLSACAVTIHKSQGWNFRSSGV